MRFAKWFAASAVMVIILASGCQMSDTSIPTEAESERDLTLSANYVEIQEMIIALFPKAASRFPKNEFLRIARLFYNGQIAAAQARTENLIDHIFAQHEAGILKDVPPSTEAAVAELVLELAKYTEVIPASAFTAGGGTVQTLDAEEPWDVETPDGYAGVTKAAGVPVFLNGQPYEGPVTIYIAPIEPSQSGFPGLGLEIGGSDRGAFPLFKDIGTIPAGLTFGDGTIGQTPDPGNELVVELCIVDRPHPLAPLASQLPDLRVGQIHDGEVQVTPLRSSTLDCSGVNDEVPTMARFENRWHRWANVALGPLAPLFDVARLYARPGRLGGAISSFSEHGGVDKTKVGGDDLTVTIISPVDGTVTSDAIVTLEGSVSDPTATATATMSGATDFEIPLTLNAGGGFSQEIPLQVGTSTITVRAVDDNENVGEDSVEVTRTGTTEELTITLTWNTATDMDLHLLRGAETPFYDSLDDCFFANCRSTNGLEWGPAGSVGNPFLDVDDTDGIGPENIRLDQVETDLIYRVGVDAFSGGPTLNTVRVTFQGATIECSRELQSGTVDDLLVVAIIDPQPGGDGAFCTDLDSSTARALRPARTTKPITKPR